MWNSIDKPFTSRVVCKYQEITQSTNTYTQQKIMIKMTQRIWNNSWVAHLIYRSESPGQVFLMSVHYLYERLKNVPETEWEKFILSYDNMCNVDKMVAAREPLPLPAPYDNLWLKVRKVIDRLHLRNHKNPRCHTHYTAEPLKDEYPHLNTMVAEQTFVWSARFKKILNAMPRRRFLFYYHRMVVRRNTYTKICHRQQREPVLPKVRGSSTTWL